MSEGLGLITNRLWNKDTDKPFIMSTMLKGLYYGDSWFSLIPKDIFMESYHPFVDKLVESPNVTIMIACLSEDPDVIIGYSIFSSKALSWVFVKKSWRGIGVGKSLIPAGLTSVSHLTNLGRKLLNKLPGVVFNPFILI